jgi:4-hydroxy-3-methylbut-2-enyl diphosphate reductase IspH
LTSAKSVGLIVRRPSGVNERVYRVRSKEEIRAAGFQGASKTAIVGGILVPDWYIEEVAQHIRAMSAPRPSAYS